MDRDADRPAGAGDGTGVSTEHVIYAVSDSTGETAEQAVRAAVAQFATDNPAQVRTFGHVRDVEAVRNIVLLAMSRGALVVYTLVDPDQRAAMRRLAQEHGVTAVDLLSGLIHELSWHMDTAPLARPGLGHETDDAYFRRIEAVEFTVNHDDGKRLNTINQAHLVFVGLSRSSKTPLSHYIAQRGYRVANVPLVGGLEPPKELATLDPRRVFALVVDPVALTNIRRRRMAEMGVNEETDYADLKKVREELLWARRLFRRNPGWTVLDITDRAIEETASRVLEIYREQFETVRAARKVAPPPEPEARPKAKAKAKAGKSTKAKAAPPAKKKRKKKA